MVEWNELTPEQQTAFLGQPKTPDIMTKRNGEVLTAVIDKRQSEPKNIGIQLEDSSIPDFALQIDVDNFSLGEYIDLSEGTMGERVRAMGSYIVVDGKLLSPDEGYKFLRAIPMSKLETVFSALTEKMSGANPN